MNEETKGKIFDKFVRGEGAEKINNAGSGLGLFVVRTFVLAHKGTIRAESQGIGKGTTFVIELPLFKEEKKPTA